MTPLLNSTSDARAVLIAGPTASGKSALALELAEAAARGGRPALIVNADAMQVYEGLSILTARPNQADEARAPHRLYGHVAPSIRYSVGGWLKSVEAVVRQAETAGAVTILVGGTGLYFKAATEGLVATPVIPDAVRRRLLERLASEGIAALHSQLSAVDPPAAASIRPGDASRTVRSLEVLEATGRPLRAWQAERQSPPLFPPGRVARFVIEPDRPALYGRIDARLDRMVAEGALGEVERCSAGGSIRICPS
jgi:tRNA dimethylallyltransferase